MRRLVVSVILTASCLLSAGASWAGEVHQYPACTKRPTDAEVQGAKGAFQAGNVSFNEADYERAILYWEDAYRRDCTVPLLLHYLSRAYEGKGDLPQAVIALRAYLERAPDAPEHAQIQKRIEVFEQRIEDDRKRSEEKQQAETAPQPVATTTVVPTESRDNSLYVNPIIPLAVGGVGIVAGVVGSVIYFQARSDLKDAEAICPDRSQCDDASAIKDGNDARKRVRWGGAVAISGLVLTAGGAGWYFFNEHQAPSQRSAAKTAIQPVIGPELLGVVWNGRF